MTVAMHLANKGIACDEYWIHNSKLKNKKGSTVAMLLSMNNIVPPKEW